MGKTYLFIQKVKFWGISFCQHSAQAIEAWSELSKFAVPAQSSGTRSFLWTNRPRWLTFPRWFRNTDWCAIPTSDSFCNWLPSPPTSSERTDLLLHLTRLISLPLPTKASNKAPAFDLHSPWVKRYAATNLQPTIHEHISDEVTQTASQPDDYSILKSFQIKSTGNNILVTQKRTGFCLQTNFFPSEIKTFWLQFHLLYCCWNEAAKSTDDVQQCPLWTKQNFIINRQKILAQLSPWAPWKRRVFSFVHFLPSQITSGLGRETLLQRHVSLLQAKQAPEGNHVNPHFCAIKQHCSKHSVQIIWPRMNVWERVEIRWPHHKNSEVGSWVHTPYFCCK